MRIFLIFVSVVFLAACSTQSKQISQKNNYESKGEGERTPDSSEYRYRVTASVKNSNTLSPSWISPKGLTPLTDQININFVKNSGEKYARLVLGETTDYVDWRMAYAVINANEAITNFLVTVYEKDPVFSDRLVDFSIRLGTEVFICVNKDRARKLVFHTCKEGDRALWLKVAFDPGAH